MDERRCRTAVTISRRATLSTIRFATIWIVATIRAVAETGAMSPKPTVVNIVTVKYSASVRDSSVPNEPGRSWARM
ncbi:hypothetical protein GCM10027598_66800 [Amycolatopsis oliviviridis]|uniref:Secreted protein n=1 Tax=Amycolatopsis oliviviridis TaxID=1471590 RepID=A0ABQ3M0H1_9PSEU|nr:hypothetical protein [Amycolatopsis oliviviridis]GHH30344.1 hypothetical protein GCM10017790_63950 [Amycolatopsis oliviviridis]